MEATSQILFPPFRLDLANESVWRGTQETVLRPKTFAVLRYLVEHADRLVTKRELLDTVWSDTCVSEDVLTGRIRELRKMFGDDRKTPRFIQTVQGRGYRFIAPLTTASPVSGSKFQVSGLKPNVHPQYNVASSPPLETWNVKPETLFVGREAELAQLHEWLEMALRGERQIVFVTGEVGIGKTTVVEAFLARLGARGWGLGASPLSSPNSQFLAPNTQHPTPSPWIARGQCIEHYGAGEAYLPVLDALGRLCREPQSKRLIELLSQYAPTWLVHMPWLLSSTELEGVQRKTRGAMRERMLREMAEALEVITTERPLVLALEDLHWSDPSTLDLLSFLAARRQRARLLLIGTYRSEEVLGNGHPLRAITQALRLHRQCDELPLKLLSEAAVLSYLAARFAVEPHEQLPRLARLVYQRAEGHPLFLVNVVDDLIARGVLAESDGRWDLRGGQEEVERGVPTNLQQMVEQQIAQLSLEEQRVLEAASVAGLEFSAAAVAAGVEGEVVQVEQVCAALVRRSRLLQACGAREWPDGTVAGQYRFIHALYQQALYERLTPGWCLHLHRQIGSRMENAYGAQTREIAAELAMHFEQGRDAGRAVQYLQQAADTALHRCAYAETVRYLSRGLKLLATLPDTPEHTHTELLLQTRLGWMLQFTQGAASAEAERTYTRVLVLCRQEEQSPQLLSALLGLRGFYLVHGELQTAYRLAEQCLSLAQKLQQPLHLLLAYNALGETLSSLGDLISARTHLEQVLALDARRYLPIRVSSLTLAAGVLGALGYPDQARKRLQEALSLAREQENPYSEVVALLAAASFHLSSREWQPAHERAATAMKIATEQGFTDFSAQAAIRHGRALVELGQQEEGMAELHNGFAAYLATGAQLARPYFLTLLAGAYSTIGEAEKGLTVLAEALDTAHKTGQRVQEAWLYWLKGTLTLQKLSVASSQLSVTNPQSPTPNPQAEAEVCFRQALDIARCQSAKALELRAGMSLSQLWHRQGKKKAAHQLLKEIYGWFTEGFNTVDLRQAKALLDKLV